MSRRRGLGLAVMAMLLGMWGEAAGSFRGFSPEGVDTIRPPEAVGHENASPSITAVRINGEAVKVDGKLDDAIWGGAPAGSGFRVWDPNRGAAPDEETVFKVAYDDDAVYFAVACLDRDPSRIEAKLSRRDKFSNSDLVSIYIDPYHDKTTGYNFKVNPLGVQVDGYLFADGQRDDNWDAVWQGETFRDDEGWYAEVRIPFSAIRYRKAPEMTWGLNVYRRQHRLGQESAWVTWDRETPGFISRFGELRGLRDIPPPRQLEILPYVLQRTTDPSTDVTGDDELDGFSNFGGDLKYGVSSALTLNATVQPDFGQVEADPAELNLSPFETFYEEKRPFFIEGSKFFQHPNFNLFYSRRIGTGDENTRIRVASKLTGKTQHGYSIAALVAGTDLTADGQAHNLFKSGERQTYYGVARFGKEFAEGRHQFNLMGTAVENKGDPDIYGPRWSREAYTGGFDYELNTPKRDYRVQGSLVGSMVDPEATDGGSDPAPVYGTGGSLQFNKRGGKLRGGISGRWEHDKLQINDVGYLSAPDEISTSAWLNRPLNLDSRSKIINNGEVNFNFWRSWLYAGRTGLDVGTGETAWSYGRGHPQWIGANVNGWVQFPGYSEFWMGIEYMPEGTQRYETRGGPLIREPTTYGSWIGGSTDTRKDLVFDTDNNHYRDVENNHSTNLTAGVRWNASSALNSSIRVAYRNRYDDTQYLETVSLAERPGGLGIGGLSYVFGDIHQQTFDVTFRGTALFSRNKSLELYLQPFVTVGDYRQARELATADSYDLVPYTEPGYDVRDFDFSFASVNLNAVYRWEYRPGSTLYLVWTHGSANYDQRSFHAGQGSGFDNSLGSGALFNTEPENTFLLKLSYWFAI